MIVTLGDASFLPHHVTNEEQVTCSNIQLGGWMEGSMMGGWMMNDGWMVMD